MIEALIAVIIWSASYPFIKIGLSEIPSFAFLGFGLSLAATFLLLFVKQWQILHKKLINIVLAQTCFQLSFILGIKSTSASNSAILLATSPIIVSLWVYLSAKAEAEIIKPKINWASLLLGFTGVCLVVSTQNAQNSFWGNLWALNSAVTWAWYSLAMKDLMRENCEESLGAALSMIPAAFIFCLISIFNEGFNFWPQVSWKGYLGLAYYAFAGLALGMLFWNKALQKYGAEKIIIYNYLEPVLASLFSVVLIDESLTFTQILGGILTFLAIKFSYS